MFLHPNRIKFVRNDSYLASLGIGLYGAGYLTGVLAYEGIVKPIYSGLKTVVLAPWRVLYAVAHNVVHSAVSVGSALRYGFLGHAVFVSDDEFAELMKATNDQYRQRIAAVQEEVDRNLEQHVDQLRRRRAMGIDQGA